MNGCYFSSQHKKELRTSLLVPGQNSGVLPSHGSHVTATVRHSNLFFLFKLSVLATSSKPKAFMYHKQSECRVAMATLVSPLTRCLRRAAQEAIYVHCCNKRRVMHKLMVWRLHSTRSMSAWPTVYFAIQCQSPKYFKKHGKCRQ